MSGEDISRDEDTSRSDDTQRVDDTERVTDVAGEVSQDQPGDTSQPAGAVDDLADLEAEFEDSDLVAAHDELAQLRERVSELESHHAELTDSLARARADHYNLNQQHNNYVKRSKADIAAARGMGHGEVVEALLPVLDDIEAARQAGDLDGPFAAIATKFESILANHYHAERFGEVGEEFDPTIHEAMLAAPSNDVEVETITQVVQHGIRIGERVVRAAKVIVASPQQ